MVRRLSPLYMLRKQAQWPCQDRPVGPHHKNTLTIWWPGVKDLDDGEFYRPFDGEKYVRYQALEAARLTGDERYIDEVEALLS